MSRNNGTVQSGIVIARTPLMPTSIIVNILKSEDPISALRQELQTNPLMRQCIVVASPSLGEAMRAWLAGRKLRNKNTPLRLLAYASRMAYRATPLGICAGIGFVTLGDSTTATLQTSQRRSATRPDMGLIGQLSEKIETGDARGDVRYVANSTLLEVGGRLFIPNIRSQGEDQTISQRSATLRSTDAVSFVRELARYPISYGRITDELVKSFDASRSDSERLVDSLIEAGLLLSELTFSPIGDPIGRFRERVQTLAPQIFADLSRALEEGARLDAQPLNKRTDEDYDRVLRTFSSLSPHLKTPIQVDMHAPVGGTIGRDVLRDAQDMASYMVRMGAVMELKSYRESFVTRFEGRERMVRLLEIVDDNLGIGAPERLEERPRSTEVRNQFVMELAQKSLIDGVAEIVLNRDDLEKLLYPADPESEPRTMELAFQIVASSHDEINAGRYLVTPSSFGGVMRAGRSLGRFMHLFSEEENERVQRLAHEIVDESCITAEIVFPPEPARLYNVAIRPRIYDAEIQVGLTDESASVRISASDLWVGIDNDRFFLWSKTLGRRVEPVESHLLNTSQNAANVCRFLAFISMDGKNTMRGFDWGPASIFRMLPRVRFGRIVLSLQRWRIPIGELGQSIESAKKALLAWRTEWSMPQFVHLRQNDNRLFLDLDSAITADILLDQVQKESQNFEFVEALPGPTQMWMCGEEGAHVAELIYAMEFSKPKQSRTLSNGFSIETLRNRWGPGSEWLYAKLYVPFHAADDLLVRHIAPLVKDLRENIGLDRWFFVRYKDAWGFHLRLRLCTAPKNATVLRESFLSLAEQWLREQRITRYLLDTYDPEYERYGGATSLEATERFFTYDSDACLALLKVTAPEDDARVAAVVTSFLGWLLGDRTLLQHLIQSLEKTGRKKLGNADRQTLKTLRNLSSDNADHSGLADLLRKDAGRLAALFHMHCNRLEVQGESEARATALLRAAALASLQKSEMVMA